MARRKSSAQQYRSRDPRQLVLPVPLPLQGPPQGPRTLATPWGTPAPVRSPRRHPAFDREVPIIEEVR
jgi:hypothetical protein